MSSLDDHSRLLEIQQLLDSPDHVAVSTDLKIRLREKFSSIEAWANEARLCHSGGRSLSDVRAVLEVGKAMHADARLVGRLSELVGAAESLRGRITTVLKVNSSGPDSLSDRGCDLRACRTLLQEAGRLQIRLEEQDQLKDCLARAEVAPCRTEMRTLKLNAHARVGARTQLRVERRRACRSCSARAS